MQCDSATSSSHGHAILATRSLLGISKGMWLSTDILLQTPFYLSWPTPSLSNNSYPKHINIMPVPTNRKNNWTWLVKRKHLHSMSVDKDVTLGKVSNPWVPGGKNYNCNLAQGFGSFMLINPASATTWDCQKKWGSGVLVWRPWLISNSPYMVLIIKILLFPSPQVFSFPLPPGAQ